MTTISANNPSRKSWLEVSQNSDFPIQNIPFGIAKNKSGSECVFTRIGDTAIDLNELQIVGFFDVLKLPEGIFKSKFLNDFIALGRQKTRQVRNVISEIFSIENTFSRSKLQDKKDVLLPISDIEMQMPVHIGDYTDFYSSEQHAYNVGCMFRDPNNALLPNWKHIPVGYHGRSSSITVSGTNFHRPAGQTQPKDGEPPVFGLCKMLDFELEMGFITTGENGIGNRITTEAADDFIFGMVIFNDWSARDIQKWEYIPLGPFLSKNFFSCISSWVVTLDALEPFRVPGPIQKPEVFDYLKYKGEKHIDINLQVDIVTDSGVSKTISNSNYKNMYWNMNQQLAHHTINGCNIRTGDLMASGTISGPTADSFGSMLELTWRGTKPIIMPDGSERKFIHDLDTVIIRGWCEKNGLRVGFGEVKSKVLPGKV